MKAYGDYLGTLRDTARRVDDAAFTPLLGPG